MIRLNQLTVRYGNLTAVKQISLEIPHGTLFGLVGPNGAGKTTTLKVLAGLILPSEGGATVDGLDVVGQRMDVQQRIGYMADFFGVYDYLTTYEYLSFFGGIYGMEQNLLEQRITEMLEITNLTIKRDMNIKTLSRGMKQRLYFARSLIHNPKLLILDEPASGMDPRGRSELSDILRRVNEKGTTIIISSHILEEIQGLCGSVGVMELGRLVGTRELKHGADKYRNVLLLVHADDVNRTIEILKSNADVSGTETHGTQIAVQINDSDETVSSLVKDLVNAGVRIQLPKYEADNLKDMFLEMTKGELT
ncbi:ABC transporter ATP-binding protein [Verrucomicrobiota bacterium]